MSFDKIFDLTAGVYFHFSSTKGLGCIMFFKNYFWVKYDSRGVVCIEAFTHVRDAFVALETLSKGTV